MTQNTRGWQRPHRPKVVPPSLLGADGSNEFFRDLKELIDQVCADVLEAKLEIDMQFQVIMGRLTELASDKRGCQEQPPSERRYGDIINNLTNTIRELNLTLGFTQADLDEARWGLRFAHRIVDAAIHRENTPRISHDDYKRFRELIDRLVEQDRKCKDMDEAIEKAVSEGK